jgi:hypothetical protein
MSSHDAVAACVCDLLRRVPDVTVFELRRVPNAVEIDFCVHSEESARALERIALGANVGINPWEKSLVLGNRTFIASTQIRDEIASGELQLLGIHLAWYLHRAGRLKASDANTLLRRWGAVEVGV